jgi:hypothetical protein
MATRCQSLRWIRKNGESCGLSGETQEVRRVWNVASLSHAASVCAGSEGLGGI